MSILLGAQALLRRKATKGYTPVPPPPPEAWLDRLAVHDANVVRHWPMDDASPGPMVDLKGVGNLAIVGTGFVFEGPSIVDLDAGGGALRIPGDEGAWLEVADHATLKTAAGTVIIFHQHDSLATKRTLAAKDSIGAGSGGAAGALSIEVQTDGAGRFFISDGTPTYHVLLGQPGDVELRKAYCTVVRWGSPGMGYDLYDEDHQLVRSLSNAVTAAPTQASLLRVGAWHTGVSRHDGPMGRIVWLNTRLSDAAVALLAIPLTHWGVTLVNDSVTVAPGSGTTVVDVQANDINLVGDETTAIDSVVGDGSAAINADGKRINYTAPAGEGSCTVTYHLVRRGASSSTGTLTVTVTAGGGEGEFTGPTTLTSAKASDNLQSTGGLNIQSASPI